ncbi:MAG: TetR/AcrR family transcriptional regulator [Candidatus Dadabacteria bacterium]
MEPKERILVKSHELFNKYGIRSVSMNDIAAQLGMSKKTLYHYYLDKDDLVDAIFSSIMEENRMHCLKCNQLGKNAIDEVFLSFEMVKEMVGNLHPSVLFDLQKYHSNTFKKFQDYRNHFLYKIIKQNIQKGMEEGLYREDIDPEILTRYRVHTILLPFDSEVFPTNNKELIHIQQQLLENFLYGIATAKGQKLVQKYKQQQPKEI